MCCRRRERRAPVLVVLGKKAYDKYQERKTRQIGGSYERSPSPEMLADQANGEILEQAGISPPSYDVVVNQARIPDYHVNVSEKPFWDEKNTDLPDTQSLHHVANGFQTSNADRSTVPAYAVQNESRCGRGQKSSCQSRCEQKRAEKLARKAQKQAEKLAARELRM